jgi:hypothetical protein
MSGRWPPFDPAGFGDEFAGFEITIWNLKRDYCMEEPSRNSARMRAAADDSGPSMAQPLAH